MGNCSGSEQEGNGPNGLKIKGNKPGQKGSKGSKVSECKVIILGDASVGKTSITIRYTTKNFQESYVPTIGAQFQQPRIQLKNGNTLKMNLWDTAGEEKFRSLLQIYYRESKGAILVYDITSIDSFTSIEKAWLPALADHIKKEEAVLFLVGNKKDIPVKDKKVETEVAQRFAESNGMIFVEVSAKSGEGIDELFNILAEKLSQKFNF